MNLSCYSGYSANTFSFSWVFGESLFRTKKNKIYIDFLNRIIINYLILSRQFVCYNEHILKSDGDNVYSKCTTYSTQLYLVYITPLHIIIYICLVQNFTYHVVLVYFYTEIFASIIFFVWFYAVLYNLILVWEIQKHYLKRK